MTTTNNAIQCFFLEPTDLVQYSAVYAADERQRFPYHRGYGHIGKLDFSVIVVPYGAVIFEVTLPHITEWPERCDYCDYRFTPNDRREITHERIWRDTADGTHWLLSEVSAGAMWFAPWYDSMFTPQLEHVLVVKLPGEHYWIVDSQAGNCAMPGDTRLERHHCWNIVGTPPQISVIRAEGKTCSPGTGAVECRSWHGNLQDGILIPK